jgi:hypothetical protein
MAFSKILVGLAFMVACIACPSPAVAIDNHLAPQRLETGDQNSIALFSPDDYAPIYYTTDGTEPSAESARYDGPVDIEGITVLKAVCVDRDGNRSEVLTLRQET